MGSIHEKRKKSRDTTTLRHQWTNGYDFLKLLIQFSVKIKRCIPAARDGKESEVRSKYDK